MTATIDKHLQAAPPALVTAPEGPSPSAAARGAEFGSAAHRSGDAGDPAHGLRPGAEAAQASAGSPSAKQRERAEAAARWRAITEAGGVAPWVEAQLHARGLGDDGRDPGAMSDREKEQFKERKRAEAAARRELAGLAWQAYRATHVNHLGRGVFWRDEVRPDRLDAPDREARARALGLEGLATADDLAKALGLDLPTLRWMSFHREVDTGSHYRRWQIPKRDGSMRTITSPKRRLKAAQRWALRNVFERLPVHAAAHGFLASRSIVTNARAHAGADVVVKVDIKDFFPTVTARRVKGLLRKAGVAEGVATLLSQIVTEAPREVVSFRGKTLYVAQGPRALPQGAPTSPAITNALCLRLDRRMAGLARALGLAYTRYADDLTFSWRRPAGASSHVRSPIGSLLRGVKQILRAEGFAIHPSKTRVMRAGNRQVVTGLVVNGAGGSGAAAAAQVRVPRETRRRLRAALHHLEAGRPLREGETLEHLRGLAAFVHMTDPAEGKRLLARVAALAAKAPRAS